MLLGVSAVAVRKSRGPEARPVRQMAMSWGVVNTGRCIPGSGSLHWWLLVYSGALAQGIPAHGGAGTLLHCQRTSRAATRAAPVDGDAGTVDRGGRGAVGRRARGPACGVNNGKGGRYPGGWGLAHRGRPERSKPGGSMGLCALGPGADCARFGKRYSGKGSCIRTPWAEGPRATSLTVSPID